MKHAWTSESSMLSYVMRRMEGLGWRSYPESCGHDLILVAGPNATTHEIDAAVEPGIVIAVEGKLQASLGLLRQATPPWRKERWKGGTSDVPHADYYVACLPLRSPEFGEVADALGICVWTTREERHLDNQLDPNHRCLGFARLPVPAVRVEVVPGTAAPRAVTPWKLAAVALCLRGVERGALTREDWEVHSVVNRRTFLDRGWCERDGKHWRILDSPTRPDRVYPEIVAALVPR